MSTVPAEPAGDTAVIEVALVTVNEVAAVVPNFTVVAPVNPVPVMTTLVVPDNGPVAGEMLVTVGLAGVTVVVVVVVVEVVGETMDVAPPDHTATSSTPSCNAG